MCNREYAQAMRQEADKWLQLMPVTKELWMEIADRIEASPDPLEIRVAARKEKKRLPFMGAHWILEKLEQRRRSMPKEVKPFEWR